MIKTTSDLLAAVKRSITIPANQKRFTDADILEICDEEIASKIIPLVSAMRQEFLVYRETQSLVAGKSAYAIPYRALGRIVKDVVVVVNASTQKQRLVLISPSEAYAYPVSGNPTAFYLENDSVVLVPTPTASTYTIEMKFMARPSKLIVTSDCGLITGISGNTLTLASTPPATFSTNNTVDLIQGKQGNTMLKYDVVVTNVGVNSIDVASVPAGLVIGDYVALSEQSPVIPLPQEAFPAIAQAVVNRLLSAQGDFEALGDGEAKLKSRIDAMQLLLEPRVQDVPRVIVNRNMLRGR